MLYTQYFTCHLHHRGLQENNIHDSAVGYCDLMSLFQPWWKMGKYNNHTTANNNNKQMQSHVYLL